MNKKENHGLDVFKIFVIVLPATTILVLGVYALLQENVFNFSQEVIYGFIVVGFAIESWGALKVISIQKRKRESELAS